MLFFNFFSKNGRKTSIKQPRIDAMYLYFTPLYRLGVKTERGIDCSNYVFKPMNDCTDTYATSKQLVDITEYVDREELKEGDLIFLM